MITLSIDVNKLDRSRLKVVPGKNGKPEAKYLELVLFETPQSEYGDYIVKQNTSKEEREKKVQMPILGNAKKWEQGTGGRSNNPPSEPEDNDNPKSDDVPF